MAARKSRSSTQRRSPRPVESVAARLPKATDAQAHEARRKFEKGIVERGEAVRDGEALTPGATHAVVGTDASGKPILKRKRFSLK
jgi:hypothetical protein